LEPEVLLKLERFLLELELVLAVELVVLVKFVKFVVLLKLVLLEPRHPFAGGDLGCVKEAQVIQVRCPHAV